MDDEEISFTLGYLLLKSIRKRREKTKNSRRNQWKWKSSENGNKRDTPYFIARNGIW